MLQVKNLFVKKGNFMLQKLSFDVPSRNYFVILGKTGSGKTMLLESIAGLHSIEGEILLDGEEITRWPPERRGVGFVYQDFMLFPNLSVRENITYAKRYKRIEEAGKLFDDLVGFLRIEKLLERKTRHLSGGEKQRIAIARAIYSRPKILLLDEPLSAVDPTFRNEIMKSLRDIVHLFDLSIVHVTHNFREASYLADRIAVILDGRILQVGRAADVLDKPTNIDVARFLGFKNLFPASILGFDQPDRYFSIDPNRIHFKKKCSEEQIGFEATVEKIMGITDHYKVFARSGEALFFAKVPRSVFEASKIREGERTTLCIDRKDVAFI